MSRKLISEDEAVDAKGQHTNPCSDCPWSRESLPGWLGGLPARQWLAGAHGEDQIDCHVLRGAECAGAAVYRANVAKMTRHKTLRLPADREKVFSNPSEFLLHHDIS